MSKTQHPYADLLTAVALGAQLQAKRSEDRLWEDTSAAHFLMNVAHAFPDGTLAYEFRIKPETKIVWLNIYSDASRVRAHDTRSAADLYSSFDRIACIQITYTPGEGL
jgi:hypothetical protein